MQGLGGHPRLSAPWTQELEGVCVSLWGQLCHSARGRQSEMHGVGFRGAFLEE